MDQNKNIEPAGAAPITNHGRPTLVTIIVLILGWLVTPVALSFSLIAILVSITQFKSNTMALIYILGVILAGICIYIVINGIWRMKIWAIKLFALIFAIIPALLLTVYIVWLISIRKGGSVITDMPAYILYVFIWLILVGITAYLWKIRKQFN